MSFIQIDREIFKHPVFQRRDEWLGHFLRLANLASVTERAVWFQGISVSLQVNEIVSSVRFLARLLGVSVKRVRLFLSALQSAGLLRVESRGQFTVLTVIDSSLNGGAHLNQVISKAPRKTGHTKQAKGHTKGHTPKTAEEPMDKGIGNLSECSKGTPKGTPLSLPSEEIDNGCDNGFPPTPQKHKEKQTGLRVVHTKGRVAI